MRYTLGLRFVLDTNILVAALRSRRGASRRLLEAVLHGRAKILASVALVLEYEEVLTRPEHLAAAGITIEETRAVVAAIAGIAEPVTPVFVWRPMLPHAADEMVLETAINGGADSIVTFNVRHFKTAAARFGIAVELPAEVCARVAGRL